MTIGLSPSWLGDQSRATEKKTVFLNIATAIFLNLKIFGVVEIGISVLAGRKRINH